jgi:hypothetical protein
VVRDFQRRKNIVGRAGKSYLALSPVGAANAAPTSTDAAPPSSPATRPSPADGIRPTGRLLSAAAEGVPDPHSGVVLAIAQIL